LLPCSKNRDGKIKIEGSIKDTLEKSNDKRKSQGRLEICGGCMMWPYMLPSFFNKVDKYFFLALRSLFNLYWKEYKIRKGAKT
jgi:hypothetical protein